MTSIWTTILLFIVLGFLLWVSMQDTIRDDAPEGETENIEKTMRTLLDNTKE